MAQISSGQVLGERFEIIGPLGRGGTATVWLAKDRVRNEQVALKVLHEHLGHDPSMRRRLQREVQATSRLDAEGALVCHDLHELDGLLAVSMPYHPGRTLTECVGTEGPLDADRLRDLGIRVAGALAQAHQRGVLHRDVTPNNLMIHQGTAMLTDFGLATTHDSTRTATSVMGTPGYAAPEVWHGARRDPRSDLYGLGATLYFAATGEAPFAAGSPGEMLTAQLTGAPPSLALHRADLPADLVETITLLLASKPDERLQSASEVVESLETRVATRPVEVARTSTPGAFALPEGDWTVVLRAPRRSRALGFRRFLPNAEPSEHARRLTRSLARSVGLDKDALTPPKSLEERRVRLVKGVDQGTAKRLDELAEAAGYRASIYNEGPLRPLERAADLMWVPIPLMWIFFAFSGQFGLSPAMLLPVMVMATVLLSVGAAPLRRRRPRSGMALAFSRDLGVSLPEASAQIEVSSPEPSPLVEETPALRALSALDKAIEQSEDLPEIAIIDLRSTARDLRDRLVALEQASAALETELGTPSADLSWAAQRLERLDTLERAGQTVSSDERKRLRAALDAHGDAQVQAADLESRLTMLRAAELEIAATARRARQSLLQSAGQADTARILAERLSKQADAADRARQEARVRVVEA